MELCCRWHNQWPNRSPRSPRRCRHSGRSPPHQRWRIGGERGVLAELFLGQHSVDAVASSAERLRRSADAPASPNTSADCVRPYAYPISTHQFLRRISYDCEHWICSVVANSVSNLHTRASPKPTITCSSAYGHARRSSQHRHHNTTAANKCRSTAATGAAASAGSTNTVHSTEPDWQRSYADNAFAERFPARRSQSLTSHSTPIDDIARNPANREKHFRSTEK